MAGLDGDGRALIAGAGIGGLSLAIALARAGIRSQVLERSRVIPEEGAGIQLGPNATRILKRWGLLDAAMARAVEPECIEIRDGRDGKVLASVPLGGTARERYGAPYIVIHRSDLHRVLLERVRGLDQVMLRRQFEVEQVEDRSDGVILRAADGASAEGRLAVGADGLWSRLRGEVVRRARPRASGKSAWRTLIEMSALPPGFDGPKVRLWMSPGAHLVHYPVQSGKALNVVAIVAQRTSGTGWSAPGDPEQITRQFRGWPEDARALIGSATTWRTWPLMDMRPLRRWTRGNVTLLGDAAHPVLPFLAQGGALAIEDAHVLAKVLADKTLSLDDALAVYERARKRRTSEVRRASRRMGRIYHLRGIAAAARNIALRRRSGEALLARYDWLYRFGEGG